MQQTDTKLFIIKSTFELLLNKGFDGVSISDIQHKTGLSRGLLYHYFGSKESLFLESIKYHFSEFFYIDINKVKCYDVDQLRRYIIKKYVVLIDETLQGVSILNYDFLLYRAMRQSKEITNLYNSVRNNERIAWSIAITNSLKKGKIRSNINIDKLSKQFIYITDGVWLAAVTPSLEVDLIKELDSAIKTLQSLIKV